jgi:hypothetical protein
MSQVRRYAVAGLDDAARRPAKCRDQRCQAPIGRHADCRNRPRARQLTVRARGSHARGWRLRPRPSGSTRRARLTRAGARPLARAHEIPGQGISPPSAYSSAESGKMHDFVGSSPPSDTEFSQLKLIIQNYSSLILSLGRDKPKALRLHSHRMARSGRSNSPSSGNCSSS